MKPLESTMPEQARDGRWMDAQRTPPRKPYEPPMMRTISTRTILPEEFGQGYETVDDEGRTVRREFRILGYVVEDPAGPAPD